MFTETSWYTSRVEQCKECASQANLIQLIMLCEDKWSLTIYHKSVIYYLFVHRVYKCPLVLLVKDGICTTQCDIF